MTLLRGLADDLKLDVWLLGYVMPVEREFVNPEFVRIGAGLGCAEEVAPSEDMRDRLRLNWGRLGVSLAFDGSQDFRG